MLGISKDLPEAQRKWKEKNMYGKKVMGTERTTVVVGTDGKVERIFSKVKVEGHVADVLGAL